MSNFKSKFTKIKGTSDVRRLPRLDKIRLGIKKISQKTGKEYPHEVEYFVCPDIVKEAYKERFPDGKITELDIMFPINDPEAIFPQAYKAYGQTRGLKCVGNGETAMRYSEDKKSMEEIICNGEECDWYKSKPKRCLRRAHLFFMIPKVSLGGVFQIDLGSYHSIVDVNSGIDFVRALSQGVFGEPRFALIPLILKRVPKETHHDGKKQIHYTLQLHCPLNDEAWNDLKDKFRLVSTERLALPQVEDVNPEIEEAAVIENGEESVITKEQRDEYVKVTLLIYAKEHGYTAMRIIPEKRVEIQTKEALYRLERDSESNGEKADILIQQLKDSLK